MLNIEAQLSLEENMVNRGAEAYDAAQRKAEEKGRASENDYARRLMQEFLLPLVERLEAFTTSTGPAARGKARGLLRRIAPDKAMFLALKQVFNSFTHNVQVVKVAANIGRLIEDEIRFSRFQEMHGDYYDTIIKDFQRKGTKDYRFMHRVLTHSANTQADQWIAWSQEERVQVGMRLLDIILAETDLVEKRVIRNKLKQDTHLVPTDAAQEWVKTHEEMARLLFPDKLPCVIPPDAWVGLNQGGYYSPVMRQSTPMVKTSGAEQRRLVEKTDLKEFMLTLNLLQDVAWSVNREVLEVVKTVWQQNLSVGMPPSQKLVPSPNPVQVPKDQMTPAQLERFNDWKREASEIYTQEKERVSKCIQVARIVRLAGTYLVHKRFWYVWYADFRGRLYTATAGFSPQGPDLAKGCLRLANGKALGPRGLYWLKVHGANRFGYDKAPYDDRAKWVEARHKEFIAAATDPLSYRSTWGDADKPWQFLAFLFEYKAAHDYQTVHGSADGFVSHLPVGLDGSCNGLQNFSAMLRDDRGGRATNLVAAEIPADIYAEVAAQCYAKLKAKAGTDPLATLWLDFCAKYGKGTIPRSLAKRPVMTLPYGATRQSCTKYIFQSILEANRDHFPDGTFKAAVWLTPLLWEAIGEVVVAAREGMDWLQKCASAVTKVNKPIIWQTSDGFPIVQFSKVVKSTQIDTQLAGRFQVKVGTITDEIDASKQRSGVAPNFVHSQDAAHLRRTVRLARQFGITELACIHDDYGTYAGDTDKLQKVIRAAFVLEYRDRDPLAEFQRQQEAVGAKLPAMPARGSLDINSVIQSPYFFG